MRQARVSGGLLVFAVSALFASCRGMSGEGGGGGAGGLGGAQPASGGATATGGASASGGTAPTGGSGPDLGGGAGAAGAPSLPGCGCSEDASIEVEFPEGPRVYDVVAEHGDGCNRLTCEPEAPYAVWRGAPPSRYAMRACHTDGECVLVETGPLSNPSIHGSVTFEKDGLVTLSEAATVQAYRVLDVPHPTLEFTFETDAADQPLHGGGAVCMSDSEYICLK